MSLGFFLFFTESAYGVVSLCWFLWLAFAGIILLLSFTMALHCFLLSLFMCSGRLPAVVSALLSAHSLTLNFARASFSTVLLICSAILVSSSFFRVGFVPREISSGILSSFIILIVFSFHVLLFPWVIFLISAVFGFFLDSVPLHDSLLIDVVLYWEVSCFCQKYVCRGSLR